MQARITILFCIAALAAASAYAQSTVYRWVDKDGKVQFSDSPPPADAKSVKERRMGGGGPSSEESNTPYATQQAAKRNPVTLYTGNDCRLCDQGRELLMRRGVPFSEKNAQASEENMEALKKLAGDLIVPLMVVGSSRVTGFDEAQWDSALDAAGYARTRLPGQPTGQAAAPK
jgi:glutaredoxin